MKTIILIIIVFTSFHARLTASSGDQSEQMAGNNDSKSFGIVLDSDSTDEGFKDANQNGIDDALEQQGDGAYRGKRDRFIDKDGDGVCDDREGCIGPKQRQRRGRNVKK